MLITNVLNVDISIDCLMILAKNSRLRERKHNKLYSKMMQKSEICILKLDTYYIMHPQYQPPAAAHCAIVQAGVTPVPERHLSRTSQASASQRCDLGAALVRR